MQIILNDKRLAINTLEKTRELVIDMMKKFIEIDEKNKVGGIAAYEIERNAQKCIKYLNRIYEVYEKKEKDETVLQNAWSEYSQKVLIRSEDVFREYADFLGGLAIREAGLDGNICKMADELVSKLRCEVNPSLTIPAP